MCVVKYINLIYTVKLGLLICIWLYYFRVIFTDLFLFYSLKLKFIELGIYLLGLEEQFFGKY